MENSHINADWSSKLTLWNKQLIDTGEKQGFLKGQQGSLKLLREGVVHKVVCCSRIYKSQTGFVRSLEFKSDRNYQFILERSPSSLPQTWEFSDFTGCIGQLEERCPFANNRGIDLRSSNNFALVQLVPQ